MSLISIFLFITVSCTFPVEEKGRFGPDEPYRFFRNYGEASWSRSNIIAFGHTPLDTLRDPVVDSSGIYLVDPDGSNKRPFVLTRNVGIVDNPRWSPDGNWLLGEISAQIVKVPITADTVIRLTTGPARKFFPSWSPDGKWIVYSIDEPPQETRGLWIVNADGTISRHLKRPREEDLCFNCPSVGSWYATQPDWSPTRVEIVYTAFRNYYGYDLLALYDTTTAAVRVIHQARTTISLPRFSPDGERIVFATYPSQSEDSKIWVINRDGSNLVQLTEDGGLHASWSPNGLKIVFAYTSWKRGDDGRNGKLWIMNADGTNQQQLTRP